MRSFSLFFIGVAFAEETCSDGTCSADSAEEVTMLQMQIRQKALQVITQQPDADGVLNRGTQCWHANQCNGQGGECPSGYCGDGGVCCRANWGARNDQEARECGENGYGINGMHTCQPRILNEGQQCWHTGQCDQQGGRCQNYCGARGVCCRANWAARNEKEREECGENGHGNNGMHQCHLPPPPSLPGYRDHNVGACRTADGDMGQGMYTRADHVTSVEECAAECDASSDCFSIEFTGVTTGDIGCELHRQPMPVGTGHTNGLCYMKIAPSLPGYGDGNMGACRTADGDAGSGMYSRAHHVTSVAECAAECDASPDCQAIEFGGVTTGDIGCELHRQPMPVGTGHPNGLCYNKKAQCALSAYWEYGNCGCGGNDQNQGWCGGIGNGDCPDTVATDICPGGTAYLTEFWPKPYNEAGHRGRGTEGHLNRDGCEYIWHAQYACQEPEFECALSAYWEYGSGGCGGNDQNKNWCGGLGVGDCPETIQTDLCPSGTAYRAVWHPKPYDGTSHAGRGTEGHYIRDGVEYIWHAQYACQP